MAEFDYSEAISEARAKYESISKALDVDRLTAEAKDLEVKAAEPGLWDDPENAQKVTSKLSAVQSQLKRLASADQRIEDVETLVELGQEEEDADTLAEAKAEVESIQKDLDDMEIQTLLDGEYDERSAVVTIRSGAGGVDAADFAQMLLRMYLRWAERNGYKAKVMDTSYAEEAGIKSATFQVDAPYAYGRLSVEGGTHRLVRISPFDNQGRRQTSFAAVEVVPLVEATDHIDVPDSEIRVDTYCSSGPGGQGVNTTYSAVRITHIPTGIVVECQDDRSQHRNKAQAMAVLAARLYDARVRAQQSAEAAQRKSLVGSGDRSERIRTYNFPQGRATDHRINLTLYKLDAVMQGELDELIDALTLEHQASLLAALADD